MAISENISTLVKELPQNVQLVAVSKTKAADLIQQAYDAGQRIFGENKVQELVSKAQILPPDIQWHMIGHLQRNKVKQLLPYVSLIHSVDSLRLYEEILKESKKLNKITSVLLQVYIATEDTKFGLDESELDEILCIPKSEFVRIRGLMGMASFSDDQRLLQHQFSYLKRIFDQHANTQGFEILSMGMSGDYKVAIACGSNMVRIGSAIFGNR